MTTDTPEQSHSATASVSLCLACGARKPGPLVACLECNHLPSTLEDRIRHLLIEARELTLEEAAEVTAAIQDGQEVQFDEDSLLTMRAALGADRPDPHWALFYGLIVAVPLLAVVIWLIIGR
jgi:hypothetical protein